MPVIPREQALQRLARHERNGMVKVVTGLRRCGKTFLLFEIFRSHLLGRDVPPDHVIGVRLDLEDDAERRDPHRLYEHVLGEVKDDAPYYVLIDEIQNAISPDEFRDLAYSSPRIYAVLNSFLARPNLDVYVTGSNSRFLSSDVLTEFRGRGTQVPLRPLTFSEYVEARSAAIEGVASSPAGGDASVAPEPSLADYLAYGGMPLSVLESFAAGRPCVTTDVGCCKELIGGMSGDDLGPAGLCVPPIHREAISGAMEYLCTHPEERYRMGLAGKERVERYYLHKDKIRNYQDTYEEVMRRWQASDSV